MSLTENPEDHIVKRQYWMNLITYSIIINCLILLIFCFCQGVILRIHHDYDAVLVLVIALITFAIELYSISLLVFIKT